MAGGPEAAIHAILTGLLNMQRLNMDLADRLDAAGWPEEEEEPQGERDQWGRTRKEARAEYLVFTRDRPTFQRGLDRWGDFAVRFCGWKQSIESGNSKTYRTISTPNTNCS